MEQVPIHKHERLNSKQSCLMSRADLARQSVDTSLPMSMPQSMMVLSEADELRLRRNTQVDVIHEDAFEDVTTRRTTSLVNERETFLNQRYLANASYTQSILTEERKTNSMPPEVILGKLEE